MASKTIPSHVPFGDLLATLFPDFVLAFVFFTALSYAVLGRRFAHHRSTVAISVALGLALSIGLVWWEQQAGLSVRNLAPIAVGLAIMVLAAVVYQAFKLAGGTVAGAGLAIGVAILISWLFQVDWPIRAEIVQTVASVALILGLIAFFGHVQMHPSASARYVASAAQVRHDMSDLYRDRRVADQLRRGLKRVRQVTDHLHEHPRDAENGLLQLRRMLPAEGWLTQRMAELRAKAHRVRQGHVARIEEIQHLITHLPPESRKQASQELIGRYRELELDRRIERLDKAVAENERRIRELTTRAEQATARHDYRTLHDLLKAAEKLQKHNSRLFKLIDSTERRLASIATAIARNTRGVSDA